MPSEEIGAYVLLAAYALLFVGAVKIFGLRRVVIVLFGIVFVSIAIAFKTLGAISTRRY